MRLVGLVRELAFTLAPSHSPGRGLEMACRRMVLVVLVLLRGFSPASAAASESTPLVGVAKAVIRSAAKIGVEEAGVRIVGPTAWRYFKEIFTPVWKELENRYPDLTLKDTKRSESAAEQAVTRLDSDRQLQQRLSDGFRKLEAGQALILVELNRINQILEDHRRELSEAKALTAKVLDELQQQRKQRPADELAKVDPFAEIKSMAQAILHWAYLQGVFTKVVVANGIPFWQYTKILPYGPMQATSDGYFVPIEPTEYIATTGEVFEDDRGRNCRTVSLRVYIPRAWSTSSIYCRIAGNWELQPSNR